MDFRDFYNAVYMLVTQGDLEELDVLCNSYPDYVPAVYDTINKIASMHNYAHILEWLVEIKIKLHGSITVSDDDISSYSSEETLYDTRKILSEYREEQPINYGEEYLDYTIEDYDVCDDLFNGLPNHSTRDNDVCDDIFNGLPNHSTSDYDVCDDLFNELPNHSTSDYDVCDDLFNGLPNHSTRDNDVCDDIFNGLPNYSTRDNDYSLDYGLYETAEEGMFDSSDYEIVTEKIKKRKKKFKKIDDLNELYEKFRITNDSRRFCDMLMLVSDRNAIIKASYTESEIIQHFPHVLYKTCEVKNEKKLLRHEFYRKYGITETQARKIMDGEITLIEAYNKNIKKRGFDKD
jgi:hypothetical protein